MFKHVITICVESIKHSLEDDPKNEKQKGNQKMRHVLFLLLSLVLTLGLVACDDVEKEEGADGADTTEVEEEAGEADATDEEAETETAADFYGIGDTVEIEDARFTLKSVTTTEERNEFADTDPEYVIAIEYELENIGDDEIPYGAELTVYDAEENKMESYPLDSDMGSLAPGKKVQGIEHHGVDAIGTIEIHFSPLFSFEDAAVFKVEVE